MARALAGDTDPDKKLWFTYYHAAGADLVGRHPTWKPDYFGKTNDPQMQPDDEILAAIRSIVFTAFVLEYRMKRACEVVGVTLRKRTMLNQLIDCFWNRVSGKQQVIHGGTCFEPPDWGLIAPKIRKLCDTRNAIAHGNRASLSTLLVPTPEEAAKEHYNAMIDAIRVINIGIGYVTAGSNPTTYFESLKLK